MYRRFHKQQYIPSSNGFNIQIRDDEMVLGSYVPYLQCLEA